MVGRLPAFALLLTAACSDPDATLGERLYQTGEGRNGLVSYSQGPRWLAYGRFGCAACHAADGAGSFVQAGQVAGTAPAVTAQALAVRGYDAAALGNAIRDGVAVDGRALGYYMPRWQLDPAEMQALIAYLERL